MIKNTLARVKDGQRRSEGRRDGQGGRQVKTEGPRERGECQKTGTGEAEKHGQKQVVR